MDRAAVWAAYEGASVEDVCKAFCFVRTGQTAEDPEAFGESVSMTQRGAWVLLWFDMGGVPKDLVDAQLGSRAVACEFSEHTRKAHVSGRTTGEKAWYVCSEPSGEMAHLHMSGPVPEAWSEPQGTENGRTSTDAGFSAVVALAQALTGFRHSQSVGMAWHELAIG